ncbi:hypothetical protein SUGI_0660530 [Cryptomeria japonica]|uniref:F-box protein GID2-like n=1 Tax=Cryptomeria japonica TaxID=3369 RepID=UPI00241494C4|nr:F-box protein GID2-like [Cryptomeria japonica]GLJ32803.1 hypothetical protein SUGI_0660530 [Cryptomeria japonica]
MKKSCTDVIHNVDALYEIFKHLDAQSLALASCVSTSWHEASIDDNSWEVICTKNWPPTANSIGRLRYVVNVLGGFRHLYLKFLLPLRRHSYCKKNGLMEDNSVPWSEDHVRLSMSLLSIEYFEKLASFKTSPF